MKYTIRRLTEGSSPSEPFALDEAEIRLGMRLLSFTKGDRLVAVDGKNKAARHRLLTILEDVDIAFRETKAERVVIISDTGDRFAVKAVDPVEPITDTEGTKAIDAIYTAVHTKFDDEFLVRDMGILVNKPGEHFVGNAWDAGTNPTAPSTTQHARILEMATYIREQGLKRDADPTKGLPVFGVIVLDKFWRTGMGRTWGVYTGTKHVSHFHVAGRPSFSGHI